MTLEQLRQNGYKVRLIHRRWYGNKLLSQRELVEKRTAATHKLNTKQYLRPHEIHYLMGPDHFGGSTTIEITTPDNREISVSAQCLETERFNRKRAVSIVLGRASKILENEDSGQVDSNSYANTADR